MRVTLFSNLEMLRPFAEDWDRLAVGNPFRSWAWNATWWHAYGPDDGNEKHQLWTLGILDDQDRLRGIAPWYRDRSTIQGTVIRFLGSGEVCSDYLGIMAAPGDESAVVNLVTEWLLDPVSDSPAVMPEDPKRPQPERWDLLHFDGIDDADPLMNLFAKRIEAEKSLNFHRKPGISCWRLELAPTMEAFLSTKSKNFKKRLKRCKKSLENAGDLRFVWPSNLDELSRYTEILIDLHQRRRESLGQPGCFASPRFEQFHRTVLPELFRTGQTTIYILFQGDSPIAADYHLLGNGIAYAYQSGIDSDCLDLGPGDIINGALVNHYIEQGILALDFLRGDEAYKQYWQAKPRTTSVWHVAAPHWSARCRHFLRRAGEEAKATAKRGLSMLEFSK